MSHDSHKDEMMIARLCQTLDEQSQQVHDFDQNLKKLAQLAQQARQQRLQKNSEPKKWWYVGGSVAIAASVTLLVFTPKQQVATPMLATTETLLINIMVEPQLLEDMEMLMVLGEEQ